MPAEPREPKNRRVLLTIPTDVENGIRQYGTDRHVPYFNTMVILVLQVGLEALGIDIGPAAPSTGAEAAEQFQNGTAHARAESAPPLTDEVANDIRSLLPGTRRTYNPATREQGPA